MKRLGDMKPPAGAVLMKATLSDLDGEYLKCHNMLALTRMIFDAVEENDDLHPIAIDLTNYWGFRLNFLGKIAGHLLALDMSGDEVERFLRHNMLGDMEVDDGSTTDMAAETGSGEGAAAETGKAEGQF